MINIDKSDSDIKVQMYAVVLNSTGSKSFSSRTAERNCTALRAKSKSSLALNLHRRCMVRKVTAMSQLWPKIG